MAQVKVCGISTPDGFEAAATAGVDWIGFVFFPASPRAVTPGQAAALARRGSGAPELVGLFVQPSDDDVARALDALPLDALQVYADPGRAAALRARFGVPVWRSVGVADRDDAPPHSDRAWHQVSVPARECLGAQRCPQGDACLVEVSRDRARSAGLVVTNHALLAIDAMHGGTALPEHQAVVIDEAHELTARVTGAASAELSELRPEARAEARAESADPPGVVLPLRA